MMSNDNTMKFEEGKKMEAPTRTNMDWSILLSSPISYPPQCLTSHSSSTVSSGNALSGGESSSSKGKGQKKSKKNEWGYDYVPSFSPCLSVNKSLHGFALTMAIERAKSLARTRRKCASLLLHVATAQDALVAGVNQALTSAASSGLNNIHSTSSSTSDSSTSHTEFIKFQPQNVSVVHGCTEVFASDHDYHLMALHQTLLQWSKQQIVESGRLKNDICKKLDEGTQIENELSQSNWSFYSEYSSLKDSCQKIHLDVKRCKRRYVKQLRETLKELDAYQQKRQDQPHEGEGTDCASAASEQCPPAFNETIDDHKSSCTKSRKHSFTTCGAIGSTSIKKSGLSGSVTSGSSTAIGKGELSSSKALWSALKELQERQDMYVMKRKEEMSHIDGSYAKEKLGLNIMQNLEQERIRFFLELLETFLKSSLSTTEKTLSCHFFHIPSQQQHLPQEPSSAKSEEGTFEDDDDNDGTKKRNNTDNSIPQDYLVLRTVSSTDSGTNSPWSSKSFRRFTQAGADALSAATDLFDGSGDDDDGERFSLPPPRQRCNTAPSTSFAALKRVGSSSLQPSPVVTSEGSELAPPHDPETPTRSKHSTNNASFQTETKERDTSVPSTPLSSFALSTFGGDDNGETSVVEKGMNSISAAFRKTSTPRSAMNSSSNKSKSRTVTAASSPAVAQSIALHLPEEAGIVRDKMLEQVSIRQTRLFKARALLQLVDHLIESFDGYASTLRGRLAHEGYSMLSNIKTSYNHNNTNNVIPPAKSMVEQGSSSKSGSTNSTTPRRSSSMTPSPSKERRRSSVGRNDMGNSIMSPASPRAAVGSDKDSRVRIATATGAAGGGGTLTVETDSINDDSTSTTMQHYETMSLFSTPASKGSGIGEPLSQTIRSVEGPHVLKSWNFTLETLAQTVHACVSFSQSLKQLKAQTLTKYLLTLQKDFQSYRESEDTRWKHLTEAALNEKKAKSRLMQTTLELQKATEKAQALEKETSKKKSDQTAVDMNPTMRKALGNMFSILPGGGEDAMTKLLSLKQRIEIAKVTLNDLEQKSHTEKEVLQKASRAKFQSFTSYTAAARSLETTFDQEEEHGWTVLVDASKRIRHSLFHYLSRRQHSIESSMSVLNIPRTPPNTELRGGEPIEEEERPDKYRDQNSFEEEEGIEVGLSFGASNKSLDFEKYTSAGEVKNEDDNNVEDNQFESNDERRETMLPYQDVIESDMTVWMNNLHNKLEQHRQRAYDTNLIGSTKDDVNLSSMVEMGILDVKTRDVIVLAGRFLLTEQDCHSSAGTITTTNDDGTLSTVVSKEEDVDNIGDNNVSRQNSTVSDKVKSDDKSTSSDKKVICVNEEKAADTSTTETAASTGPSYTSNEECTTVNNGTSNGQEITDTKEKIRTFCNLCIYDWTTAQTLMKNILDGGVDGDGDDSSSSSTVIEIEWNALAKQLHSDIREDATAMIEAAAAATGGGDDRSSGTGSSSLMSSFTKSQETNVFLQHFWNNVEDRHKDDSSSSTPPTIIQSFSCAYWPNKDDGEQSLSPLLHGRMFCTSQKMYFVGWGGKKIILLWNQVLSVHKDTTVSGMVDNALRLEMKKKETSIDSIGSYFFGSFAFRDKAYDLLHQLVSVSHSLQTFQTETVSNDVVMEGTATKGDDDEKKAASQEDKVKPTIELKPVPPDPVIKKMDPLITKKVGGISVDTYYKHIWSEGNTVEEEGSDDSCMIDAFYKPWLEETGNHEVTISDWEHGTFVNSWCGETYSQRRVVTFKYTRTTYLYVGPPIADVTQTQYCRVERQHKDGPADKCVLAMTVKMEGIPYADTFLVQIRWVGRRLGHGPVPVVVTTGSSSCSSFDLQLDAGVYIEFIKSSMFASKIRAGTIDESKPTHVDLLKKIEKRLKMIRTKEEKAITTTAEIVTGVVPTGVPLVRPPSEEEEEQKEGDVSEEEETVEAKPLSPQEKALSVVTECGVYVRDTITSVVEDPLSHPLALVSLICFGIFFLRCLFSNVSLSQPQSPSGMTQTQYSEMIQRMDALSNDVNELKDDMEKILKLLASKR